jgi:hypothetical protein
MKQLQELLPKNSELILINGEVSLYNGSLSTPCVIQNIKRIKSAFPSLPEGFYEIFAERIIDCVFTDERLDDAVNNVIDNCVYPTPTIAQFISFDKRVKVFKYPDIIKMIEDGDPEAFSRYKRIEMPGLPEAVWIHVNDIAKYKIKV